MTNSDNIPTFNDICGTVTQALAETIINREAIIAELREKNARTEQMLRERCTNYTVLAKENEELRKQIGGWRTECEIHEKDEKELYRLRDEVRSLRTQLFVSQNEHGDCDKQCKELLIENQNLKEDFGRGDAYWTAIRERDDARRQYCELVHNTEGSTVEKIAHFNGWNDLYPAADNTPSLFEQNEVRRTRRSDFTEQQSDSDPETGVQYGDLN